MKRLYCRMVSSEIELLIARTYIPWTHTAWLFLLVGWLIGIWSIARRSIFHDINLGYLHTRLRARSMQIDPICWWHVGTHRDVWSFITPQLWGQVIVFLFVADDDVPQNVKMQVISANTVSMTWDVSLAIWSFGSAIMQKRHHQHTIEKKLRIYGLKASTNNFCRCCCFHLANRLEGVWKRC